MPFWDAYISDGALSPSAERELLGRITDLLLEHSADSLLEHSADSRPRRAEQERGEHQSAVPQLLGSRSDVEVGPPATPTARPTGNS
jgi:hypothetical protein